MKGIFNERFGLINGQTWKKKKISPWVKHISDKKAFGVESSLRTIFYLNHEGHKGHEERAHEVIFMHFVMKL
jgi:hypothetical protein